MSLSMSVQLDQYALQRLASINDIRAMLQNRIIPEVSVLVKKLEDEAKKNQMLAETNSKYVQVMQKIIEVGDGSQAVILVNNLLHPAVSVMPVDDQYESNSNSNISNVFVSDDPLFDGLNDYQVAFLDTLHASQDEVAAHLRRHSKVRIVSQTENAALGEWVLSVVGDEGMWIDCLSSQLEAIDQANKLGLQIVI